MAQKDCRRHAGSTSSARIPRVAKSPAWGDDSPRAWGYEPGNQTSLEANIAQQDVRDRAGSRRSVSPETPPQRQLRVAVAESSYVTREFLADALSSATQVELVAVCCNGSELGSAIATWRPDVVLTDDRMPTSAGDEGLRIASLLRETNPEAGVVLLSERAEPGYAVALLAGGSRGRAYLLKERIRNRRELIRVIEAVARGESVIDGTIIDLLMQDQTRAAQSRLSALTLRERELLASIATGQSNAAIADSLFLTTGAVAEQARSIFAKLKLTEGQDASHRARAILVFLAEEQGAAQT